MMRKPLSLMRIKRDEFIPVDDQSVALFRLGEQCNNACPMCSNSGRSEGFFIPVEELFRRVKFLAASGFRRVVMTGGEPTIHPAFWSVVERAGEQGIVWDVNTHGRSFSEAGFTERAVATGLRSAIVSLHSHRVDVSCLISGTKEKGHFETIDGIGNLLEHGVPVLVNLVVTRYNQEHLVEFLSYCLETFGAACKLKYVFPSTGGKGGDWKGIELRYGALQETLARVREQAAASGQTVFYESFPPCISGEHTTPNMSRSGFGETHYLEDIRGRELFSIRHIEAQLNVFPSSCKSCAMVRSCSGVSLDYLKRYGGDEFQPITL